MGQENEQQGSQQDLYDAINSLPVGEKVEAPSDGGSAAEETPQETPKEETPQENSGGGEPAKEVPDTPKDEDGEGAQASEAAPQEQTVETEEVFEINDFNQRFEKSFTNESELKLALDGLERIKELEGQVAELEDVKKENLLIKENLDPRKYFESDDEFRAVLFKKQFPDRDAATAFKLMSSDISQMEPKDLIAYEMMLNTPGITKADADAIINQTYNIEDGEIQPTDLARIKVDGANAARNIGALKSQITLPEKTDVDSLVSQQKEMQKQKMDNLMKGWGDVGKEVERTLSDLNVSGKDAEGEEWGFTYSMSKDFPTEVTQSMVDFMAKSGVELTNESVQIMGEAMQKEYFYRNMDKIITAVRDDTIAKFEEKKLREQHNTETPKPNAEPSGDEGADMNSQILSELNKGAARSTFFK